MNRREALLACGTATTIALAGCLGSDSTDSPESVVTAFYGLLSDGDDGANDLLHPDATFGETGEEELEIIGESFEISVEESEVSDENLNSDELSEELADAPEESLEEVADTENALVEGEIYVSITAGDGEEIGEQEGFGVIVAKDDGDWLIVDEVGSDF